VKLAPGKLSELFRTPELCPVGATQFARLHDTFSKQRKCFTDQIWNIATTILAKFPLTNNVKHENG